MARINVNRVTAVLFIKVESFTLQCRWKASSSVGQNNLDPNGIRSSALVSLPMLSGLFSADCKHAV